MTVSGYCQLGKTRPDDIICLKCSTDTDHRTFQSSGFHRDNLAGKILAETFIPSIRQILRGQEDKKWFILVFRKECVGKIELWDNLYSVMVCTIIFVYCISYDIVTILQGDQEKSHHRKS